MSERKPMVWEPILYVLLVVGVIVLLLRIASVLDMSKEKPAEKMTTQERKKGAEVYKFNGGVQYVYDTEYGWYHLTKFDDGLVCIALYSSALSCNWGSRESIQK